jgi:uncharacterized protein (DUF58 family)
LIYPSGRAAALAAAAAVPAFVIAVAVPAYWYAGLFGVAFIVALALVDLAVSAPVASMRARVEAPRGAYVGQDVSVTVRADGAARRIEAAVGHDDKLVARRGTPTMRDGHLTLTLDTVRRGSARLNNAWVRWAGPFGLIWRQVEVKLSQTIAIVPDIRPARADALRLFRRDMPIGETVQIDRGVGSEFQALAEFRTGMDRRAIDWKRSAHHSKLLAKEYRIERNNDIVFAIDGGRLMSEPVDGLPKVDRAVTAALSAAFVALKLGDKVSLFAFDSRPRVSSGAVSGAGSFGVFQRMAADIEYSANETNYTFALTTLGAKLVRRSFVLIFTDFADPTSAELMLRSIGQLTKKHLILFVLMRDVELETLAAAAPETAKDVSRAVTAASLLRERRIVIARLQRLGAHVIEAPHERLGTDLVNAYLDMKRRDLV